MKQELLERVKAAFPDPGWPIDEPATYGDPTGCFDSEYIRDHYQGRRWCEMTHEELQWMSQDGWAFSSKALLYFLPAFIYADIVHDWEHLERLSHWINEIRETLVTEYSEEQRSILLEVLLITFPERDYFRHPTELIDQLLSLKGRLDQR